MFLFSESCHVEVGTNYCGYDIADPIEGVCWPQECKIRCQNNDKCQFWTSGELDGVCYCYLKSSDAGREYYNGLSSGAKYCRKLT